MDELTTKTYHMIEMVRSWDKALIEFEDLKDFVEKLQKTN